MVVDLWHESATAVDEDDIPNVVNLNVAVDHSSDGASWVYLPSKNTIYIGGEGSHHIDISHVLRKLISPKGEVKPITGVMYDDGYVDLFKETDKSQSDRILRALQQYHSIYKGTMKDLNQMEDETGDGWYNYPKDDPEDTDFGNRLNQDYDLNDLNKDDDRLTRPSWDNTQATPAWWDDDDLGRREHITMKPTPGVKSIHDWEPQDYLDWRDKKSWDKGQYSWSSPREDYPHWRWSYGDSSMQKGAPHEGLWVWPTEHGYPDHFSQTGSDGLGNCAQGRVYPHEGEKWEILTWADRPRHAPDGVKTYLQHEAGEAVKQYLMEKLSIPEDKIYFNTTTYGPGVTMHNSPSYPREDYGYSGGGTSYNTKKWISSKQPVDWSTVDKGYDTHLFDDKGREWVVGAETDPKDRVNGIFLFTMSGKYENTEIDRTNPPQGWTLGEEDKAEKLKVVNYDDSDGSATYQYKYDDKGKVTPSPSQVQHDKWPGEADNNPRKKIIPPKNGWSGAEITYHPNGKQTYRSLSEEESASYMTPEEKWELAVKKFDAEQAKGQATVMGPADKSKQDMTEEMIRQRLPSLGPAFRDKQRQDEYIEKNYPHLLKNWKEDGEEVNPNPLYSFMDQGGKVIHVSPEDYELAHSIHGEDWHKSFIPERKTQNVH